LALSLPGSWLATLSGFAGADNTDRFDDLIDKVSGDNLGIESLYENSAYGGELDVEGRLVTLAGGDVRLAVGGGYRHNRFSTSIVGVPSTESGSRGNYYGFGEVSIPLVSASNATPFLYQLALSGAVRHEEYDRFGGVTTPKLGAVYAPSPDIAFKLSWGRSFKAPTLLQQYRAYSTTLRFAAQVGGSGFPAGATVLVTGGGNPDLRPERARTLSTTAELHPRAMPGLNLSATYFDVDYTDRVVQPLLPPFAALSSPVLAQFIDYNPTPAKLAALIARDPDGLYNTTRTPYDPAKVVAIANGILINAARQRIHGVDFVGSYRLPVGRGNDVTLSAQGSWLTSSQRNSAGAPLTKLAGTNFNPPRFRGRGGVTGHFGAVAAAGFINYMGGLIDATSVPAASARGMTSVDLTLIWKVSARAKVLRGLELSMTVQNLTNSRPPYLAPLDDSTVNYDSTNYSPLGRFVSATVRKTW
jgi:outer membrane receptor protein involved in Fe transport